VLKGLPSPPHTISKDPPPLLARPCFLPPSDPSPAPQQLFRALGLRKHLGHWGFGAQQDGAELLPAQGHTRQETGGDFLRDTAHEDVHTTLPVFNGVSAAGCLHCSFSCCFSEHFQADTATVPLPGASRQSFQRTLGAHGHRGPADSTFFLRPCAVQESEGILHQRAMTGTNDLQLSPTRKCASSNNQGLEQYLVEVF